MALVEGSADPARERLSRLRNHLLDLHKALLDSEKTAYQIVHGPIASPAAFLQLLINDSAFAWLRPVTTLVVQIDEALAQKNPPATAREFEQLITDTKALLTPSRDPGSFWDRYTAVIQRDPAVAVLHLEIKQHL